MRDRVVTVTGPGRVELVEREAAALRPGTFRVETLFSGVSAGTELSYVKGTNPYLNVTWNADLGLFQPGDASTPYPVTRLGYMQVGRVVESATPAITVGTVGAMTYGHRTGWLADPVAERFVPLPDDLDPLLGVYVAHMGPICANGLLHAAADLHGTDVRSLGDGVRGRRVAVVGAGVVGLLTALLARRHGAASVVVLDPTAGSAATSPRRSAWRPSTRTRTTRRWCSRPGGRTPPATGAPTWSSSAGGRRGRCNSRCGCCAHRAP